MASRILMKRGRISSH